MDQTIDVKTLETLLHGVAGAAQMLITEPKLRNQFVAILNNALDTLPNAERFAVTGRSGATVGGLAGATAQ